MWKRLTFGLAIALAVIITVPTSAQFSRLRFGAKIATPPVLDQLPFDNTNPVFWDNDSEQDVFSEALLMALAQTGRINLIGMSRDPNPFFTLADGDLGEFDAWMTAASDSGWTVPAISSYVGTALGADFATALTKPTGGCDTVTSGGLDCINSTSPIDREPAQIMMERVLAVGTTNKPVVIATGGCLTTVASAYLLARAAGHGTEFADKAIVVGNNFNHAAYPDANDYNSQQDEWALFIVMNRLRHVFTPFTSGAMVLDETQSETLWTYLATTPANPMGDFIRYTMDNTYPYGHDAIYGDFGPILAILYPNKDPNSFFNGIMKVAPTNVFGAWPVGYPDHGPNMLNDNALKFILPIVAAPLGDDYYISDYNTDFTLNALIDAFTNAFNSVNLVPNITISASPMGPSYTAPATVTITPTATDADGTVTEIDYFDASDDSFLDFTTIGAPYVFSSLPAGDYSIYAVATDNDLGVSAQSNTISFTVAPSDTMGDDNGGYRAHYTGAGFDSLGGRGTGSSSSICHVTSLNDTSGSPSLIAGLSGGGSTYNGTWRQCANLATPRYVVFDVCGTIQMTGPIIFTQPYMTVAGQTACGQGVTFKLYSGGDSAQLWYMNTHDVVFQHVRIRAGANTPSNIPGGEDSLRMGGVTAPTGTADRIVFDHVTFSWATHLMAWGDEQTASNMAFYDSMFYEGLNTNIFANQTMALLFYRNSICSVTIQRSIFAHNDIRNPLVGNGCKVSYLNNVVYDFGNSGQIDGQYAAHMWGSYASCDNVDPCPDPTGPNVGPFEAVWVGNTYLWGPSTGNNAMPIKQKFGSKAFPSSSATPTRAWLDDNADFEQDRVTHGWFLDSTQSGQWNGVEVCAGSGCGGGFVNGVSTNAAVDDSSCNLVGGFGIRETNPACISWYTGYNFNIISRAAAYAYDLLHAGAFPTNRDYQDNRIANPSTGEIANGTGAQISNPALSQSSKANLSYTTSDGYPILPTSTSVFPNPSTPWVDGTCGSRLSGPRTVLDCLLETYATGIE